MGAGPDNPGSRYRALREGGLMRRISARRSKDDILSDELVYMRKHFDTCRECHSAIRVGVAGDLCYDGASAMFRVATKLNDVITLRVRARKVAGDFIIACPDPGKHGKAYQLTAAPLCVVEFQDRLL